MASVFDVAKYIVNKIGPVTTMKLQKLVYYSQAWNLAWDDVPLFAEDFEAWTNGPVCPDLYRKHKGKFIVDESFLENDAHPDSITPKEMNTIDAVLEFYGDKEPHWLSELTHLERPWREARGDCPIGYPSGSIINKALIHEYYSSLING